MPRPLAKVLITGAGGFLGQNLAEHLARAGIALTLNALRAAPALRELSSARLVCGPTLLHLDELDLANHDALVHLASCTNPRVGTLQDELRQLGELARLLDLISHVPDLALVFISSGGTVYRDSDQPHSEDDPLAPQSHHAWGKVAAEELIRCRGRSSGLRFKIIRTANPYGPFQSIHKRQGLIAKLLHDLRRGETTEIWGDGLAIRDYFFVADLCRLLESMLERPEQSGIFNAGSGVGTTVLEVVDRIEEVVGVRPRLRHVPSAAGAVRHNVLRIERARRAFGWAPVTSLTDGIRATWDWLERSECTSST